jgi:hypothetical protein
MKRNGKSFVGGMKVRAQVAGAILLLAGTGAAWAQQGGVTFENVAGTVGIDYERTPSPRKAVRDAIDALAPIPVARQAEIQLFSPQKEHGAPGVALFDYDNDGDVDIYVTNGPGTPNSLFRNQLTQTGTMGFTDVAQAAGVTATAQDSSGVCYGDIDNDGHEDLYVLGTGVPNILYHNDGDGTFTDITASAKMAGRSRHAAGCSMGDINADGLLDIVVANTYDNWNEREAVFSSSGYTGLEPNDLFLNRGGNTFSNVSVGSGIRNLVGGPPSIYPGGSYTWAVAMVDYDQDGDVDIIWADTQGAPPADRSQERGYIRIFRNDGTGHFADVTRAAGMDKWGAWMGLAFGDFNCDGNLDLFGTNLGVYMGGVVQNSRWFLGSASGRFTDPGVGALVGTPFGWGAVSLDYDNDGAQDLAFFGDDDVVFFVAADNPGTLLHNPGCSAKFTWDQTAMKTDHRLREVHGVATADLNGDGYDDLVTVSNFKYTPTHQRPFTTAIGGPTGSPFDSVSVFENVFTSRLQPGFLTYLNPVVSNGDLAIDLNSGNNGNASVGIKPLGGIGLVANRYAAGKVNRDGIGAIVRFTPDGGHTVLKPVLGGASYGSQDSRVVRFGLGTAAKGTVDILWPGGLHNRLYDVAADENLTVPEIPCDFTRASKAQSAAEKKQAKFKYYQCVKESLKDLVKQGVISKSYSDRLEASAGRARQDFE